jgi:hypothetical protein
MQKKQKIRTIRKEISFREDFHCHSTWKRCKHSGHFFRFRNIIGNFCIIKQKCYVIRRMFKMCFENAVIVNGCQLIQSILYYKLKCFFK